MRVVLVEKVEMRWGKDSFSLHEWEVSESVFDFSNKEMNSLKQKLEDLERKMLEYEEYKKSVQVFIMSSIHSYC